MKRTETKAHVKLDALLDSKTQKTLAREMGTSGAVMSRIVGGLRPSLDLAIKMEAFGIPAKLWVEPAHKGGEV